MLRSIIVSALCLPLASCIFYLDDNDDCEYYDLAPVATVDYLNPDTGTCESLGGPIPEGGGDCGRAVPGGNDGLVAAPDWALCESECTGLDEASCLDAAGCRAGYIDECGPDADCDESAFRYYACWATAPSGPVQGECAGLDSWECSRHDDCAAIHYPDCYGDPSCNTQSAGIDRFELCLDERPPDTQPLDGTCYQPVVCESEPPYCPPATTIPGRINGCWTGQCIFVGDCSDLPPDACPELGEDQCIGRADCTARYEGIDCMCTPEGCTCADHIFQSCT